MQDKYKAIKGEYVDEIEKSIENGHYKSQFLVGLNDFVDELNSLSKQVFELENQLSAIDLWNPKRL